MKKTAKVTWRVNGAITAKEIRVIGSDGKQVGVLGRNEALDLAKKSNLDLVEIASRSIPPVAKIVDFGKFRYQEEKKERKEKKKQKGGEIKEIRFSPFIADNDYNTRIERIKEFLGERQKVRTVVVFTRRQMGSKAFGYQVLGKIKNHFGEVISIDSEPKFFGRHLSMVISPKSNINSNAKKKNQEINNEKV